MAQVVDRFDDFFVAQNRCRRDFARFCDLLVGVLGVFVSIDDASCHILTCFDNHGIGGMEPGRQVLDVDGDWSIEIVDSIRANAKFLAAASTNGLIPATQRDCEVGSSVANVQ